jgi:diguanylate cyclase (GGDEF)-like protein
MALNEKNILNIIATGPLVFIPLVIIVTALLLINIYNDSLEKSIDKMESNLIEIEKKTIQTKVNSIADLIVYQKSILVNDLKSRIEQRVVNAINMANTIYDQYKDSKTEDEIKNIITTTLRPLQWNRGESYIWIVDYQGIHHLGSKNISHLEGSSILDLKDANDVEIIKKEIDLCKTKGEGYLWDSFFKPGDTMEKQFQQLAFVNSLGHYDWYIGSAEFLETAIEQRDHKLLKGIEKIGGPVDHYIFIINTKGDMLLNPSKPELVGKNILTLNSPLVEKNFLKIKQALQDKDHAFLSYKWINPETGKEETKHTYIHTIAGSTWIIGSGFYNSTIKRKVEEQTKLMHEDYYSKFKYLIFISILFLVLGLFISYLLSRYLKKSFFIYRQKIKKSAADLQAVNENLEGKMQERTKELQEKTVELQILAHHDALTNLPNRVLFTDRLERGITHAKRNQSGLALFFIDLDKFKYINDSLGHSIGDSVLKEVANRLENIIREEDTLARLSGDEFTIIMEELAHPEDASLLAEKILKTLAEVIIIDEHMLYISGSIGISLCPEDSKNVHSLLKYADTAMYKAKEEGRNNFQFYSADMTKFALARMEMTTALRQAIENEEFILHYQAQINAKTNTLVGLEALIRWKHPSKGLLSPDTFIPLAEETGMIVKIDQWVMKTAMQQIVQWYKEGLNPGVLAVNLSIQQLECDNFLEKIETLLKTYNFDPKWLELEITERQMMKKTEEIISKLNQIHDLGIGISIDDFGTGYSSLSLLKRLPINRLKIDRSFIKDIPEDKEDIAIIKAIIALAKSLNLDLIAEGVENAQQKKFLIIHDCTHIQGHYYSHALPAEKMRGLLFKA